MNIERLRFVKEIILEEPRRLRMERFGMRVEDVEWAGDHIPPPERPPCGTVMCIAGTGMLAEERERGLFRKRFTKQFVERMQDEAEMIARDYFGLTEEEADRLFYFKEWQSSNTGNGWPLKFSEAYSKAKTPIQRARVAARRIEHFIKTNGEE